MSSPLTSQVTKLGNDLRSSSESQVSDYKKRFDTVKGMYDEFLKDLIVQGFNSKKCFDFASKFFGSPKIEFAAIDGTEYAREIFDLVIFFGGAYACIGEIDFLPNSNPIIKYNEKVIQEGWGISSCVPLYINEVPDVDQTFLKEKEGEIALGKSLKDEEIIDNSQISNFIMHFAEYFLAFSIVSKNDKVRLLLMDRTLSGDQAGLIGGIGRSGKDWEEWRSRCSLVGYKFKGREITPRMLDYGRYRIYNKKLDLPPSRGDYLKYRILCLMEEKGKLRFDEIVDELNIQDRRERVQKILDNLKFKGFVKENDGFYELSEELKGSWNLLKELFLEIGRRIFEENNLRIEKDGKQYWLTTLDLSFLTIFCFNALIEECWKRKILIVGLTKDTSAKEFKRHFIPICQNNNIISSNISQEKLALIPNTDRMFLQSVSLLNHEKINPPWGLVEYDTSFKTLVPSDDGIEFVKGAIRNKISPEKFFLKSYIQLVKAESDPKLRSNVLAIDRLVYEEDVKQGTIFTFKNKNGRFIEPVEVVIYKDKNVENQIQNMLLEILSSMSDSNIPELFGHNKPLFIADKIAKWHVSLVKNIIEAMERWIMNNPELRDFIFYMTTFRVRRGEIERFRRE
jgi:hypothetical protein